MKKIKIAYWIVTGLFAAFMLFSAIPNIIVDSGSIDLIVNQMHYPQYIIRFVGIAKLLGAIAILVPGYPRIKEWAYAGLTFDLVMATYSFIALGIPPSGYFPMFIFIALAIASYVLYHKKAKPQLV